MTTASGVELIIKIGNGADPEVFTEPCGLTTRGFSRDANTNAFDGYDCNNPDAPGWQERLVQSFSSSVTGSGHMHTESIQAWNDFFNGGISKNVQITVPGIGDFVGKFICTALNLSGNKGDKIEIDVTLESDGPVALVA